MMFSTPLYGGTATRSAAFLSASRILTRMRRMGVDWKGVDLVEGVDRQGVPWARLDMGLPAMQAAGILGGLVLVSSMYGPMGAVLFQRGGPPTRDPETSGLLFSSRPLDALASFADETLVPGPVEGWVR